MSTKCDKGNWTQFCSLFENKLNQKYTNHDEALEVYTNLITEGEKCLNAIDDLSAKQTLCEKLALGFNERGMVKYMKVDFDEAIEDYTRALSYNDKLHVTYYNRGLIHYRLARFDKAIEDMKKVLELKPDFDSAQKCLNQAQLDKTKAM